MTENAFTQLESYRNKRDIEGSGSEVQGAGPPARTRELDRAFHTCALNLVPCTWVGGR